MEITCSLKGCHLQWIFPSEVKDLCVQCASKDHKTKKCDAFEKRGRRTIPKNVQNNYARFKPVGYIKSPSISRSRGSFTSRSRSRSHFCSSNKSNKNNNHNIDNSEGNTTKHNDNKTDNSIAGSGESSLSTNIKSVTYAEQVASSSLQISIHAPHKYTTTTKSVRLSLT